MAYKGIFKPKNTSKYRGDFTNIVYRSRWELVFMSYLDDNDNVLSWSSEEVIVPYISTITGKRRRYFPDFWTKVKQTDGSIKEFLIEIKPYKQTILPRKGKNQNKYLMETKTYVTNQDKWKYAMAFCNKRNWEFKIVTEKDLNLKF